MNDKSLLKILYILFFLSFQGTSVEANVVGCYDIQMGSHNSHNNNVIAYGKVNDPWKLNSKRKSGILRKNRETDNFYIKGKNIENLHANEFIKINSTNNEFAYSMFEIVKIDRKKDEQQIFNINLVYICLPYIKTILTIEIEITVPGCPMNTVKFEKHCGITLTPIPGLQGVLKTGENQNKSIPFIHNGLFDIDEQDPIYDPSTPMMNDFKLLDNSLELTLFTELKSIPDQYDSPFFYIQIYIHTYIYIYIYIHTYVYVKNKYQIRRRLSQR